MLAKTLAALFTRDLTRLKEELSLYKNPAAIWMISGQANNSAGNLCLHLIGNLNSYIGATLGHTGYIRNRELEFNDTAVPLEILQKKISDTIGMLNTVVPTLSCQQLEAAYPLLVLEQPTSTGFLLTHLATHLGYHLGQVSYHRRLLDSR
jgi:hypothetical protein